MFPLHDFSPHPLYLDQLGGKLLNFLMVKLLKSHLHIQVSISDYEAASLRGFDLIFGLGTYIWVF